MRLPPPAILKSRRDQRIAGVSPANLKEPGEMPAIRLTIFCYKKLLSNLLKKLLLLPTPYSLSLIPYSLFPIPYPLSPISYFLKSSA
ncbi:MAG: hypothetical protein LBP59_03480 [Planctomycetaceae bacterium]|nr:hypothetical protein [Planctomycetaceae bacterium]